MYKIYTFFNKFLLGIIKHEKGLLAYTVERIVEARQLMELRIYNSEIPWDDFCYPIKVGRTITALKWNQTGELL